MSFANLVVAQYLKKEGLTNTLRALRKEANLDLDSITSDLPDLRTLVDQAEQQQKKKPSSKAKPDTISESSSDEESSS
eukprot:CAMPEP_0174243448 /NCGR_PEP_ID=MMETSP0417-20130205/31677_1 /TAXON_ID=242541 /ORGANISM="Mayorella sp, Strain BSH-02190019" /LENGTH=77 /DNA_ID=CAMNT_0015322973 /DNA_START=120 /DNA_END=349 /DNA_ORIENTATION=+